MSALDIAIDTLKVLLNKPQFRFGLLMAVIAITVTALANSYFFYRVQPRLELRARGFQLYDDDGHVRAALLAQSDGSPELALRDGRGLVRAALSLGSEGAPMLRMRGADGGNRIELHTEPDGSPVFILRGKGEENRIWLRVEPDGSPHLLLWDGSGAVRAELTTEAEGSGSLLLYDKGGALRVWLEVDSTGTPSISVVNDSGTRKARLLENSLILLGENGYQSVRLTSGSGDNASFSLQSRTSPNRISLDVTDHKAALSATDAAGHLLFWPK